MPKIPRKIPTAFHWTLPGNVPPNPGAATGPGGAGNPWLHFSFSNKFLKKRKENPRESRDGGGKRPRVAKPRICDPGALTDPWLGSLRSSGKAGGSRIPKNPSLPEFWGRFWRGRLGPCGPTERPRWRLRGFPGGFSRPEKLPGGGGNVPGEIWETQAQTRTESPAVVSNHRPSWAGFLRGFSSIFWFSWM